MPLVSIIVPIYNVEKFLERCVNSILAQTFQNFELILVDDGSPDHCPEMCDMYSMKDSRIKVIHKKNGGLSEARNAGLDIAQGQYYFFVDSDDMIAPNALQLLVKYAKGNSSDVIISKSFICFFDKIDVDIAKEQGEPKIMSAECALEEMFCKNTRWEAWGTLFAAETWGDLRFKPGIWYEDLELIPEVISRAKQVSLIDVSVYYYYKREGSIMDESKTRIKIDLLEACKKCVSLIETQNVDKQIVYNTVAGVLYELASRLELASHNKKINSELLLEGKKYLKKNDYYIINSNRMPFKLKLYCICVGWGLESAYVSAYKIRKALCR